jgi:hypothetical protein
MQQRSKQTQPKKETAGNPAFHRARYQAYLLRVWAEPAAGSAPIWRFSLQAAGSQERRGFAELGDLLAFLQAACQE